MMSTRAPTGLRQTGSTLLALLNVRLELGTLGGVCETTHSNLYPLRTPCLWDTLHSDEDLYDKLAAAEGGFTGACRRDLTPLLKLLAEGGTTVSKDERDLSAGKRAREGGKRE